MQLNKDVYKLELKEKDSQIVPYQKNILFRNSMYPILLLICFLGTGLVLSRKFSCDEI